MSMTEFGILQELHDEDEFPCDGNVVPWSIDGFMAQNWVVSHLETFGHESLKPEPLMGLQALQMGEFLHDDYIADEVESATTTESDVIEFKVFHFLSLPFEIRLQIYGWLHYMHPVKQAQLTPWYPTPVYSTYFLKTVTTDTTVEAHNQPSEKEEEAKNKPHSANNNDNLLSPYRPLSGLPNAFLRANKQIHQEARALPFLQNEFVFVNWFASGLWAAQSFSKGLRSWQLDSMRHARLELLTRDLSGAHAEEWAELCELWSGGLHSLRLKILSGGFGSCVVDGMPGNGAPVVKVRGEDERMCEWVERGLRSLRKLRTLEVELLVAGWDGERKIEWCRDLQEAINEGRPVELDLARVVCVERDSGRLE